MQARLILIRLESDILELQPAFDGCDAPESGIDKFDSRLGTAKRRLETISSVCSEKNCHQIVDSIVAKRRSSRETLTAVVMYEFDTSSLLFQVDLVNFQSDPSFSRRPQSDSFFDYFQVLYRTILSLRRREQSGTERQTPSFDLSRHVFSRFRIPVVRAKVNLSAVSTMSLCRATERSRGERRELGKGKLGGTYQLFFSAQPPNTTNPVLLGMM
jgi:hypothetical protein